MIRPQGVLLQPTGPALPTVGTSRALHVPVHVHRVPGKQNKYTQHPKPGSPRDREPRPPSWKQGCRNPGLVLLQRMCLLLGVGRPDVQPDGSQSGSVWASVHSGWSVSRSH